MLCCLMFNNKKKDNKKQGAGKMQGGRYKIFFAAPKGRRARKSTSCLQIRILSMRLSSTVIARRTTKLKMWTLAVNGLQGQGWAVHKSLFSAQSLFQLSLVVMTAHQSVRSQIQVSTRGQRVAQLHCNYTTTQQCKGILTIKTRTAYDRELVYDYSFNISYQTKTI